MITTSDAGAVEIGRAVCAHLNCGTGVDEAVVWHRIFKELVDSVPGTNGEAVNVLRRRERQVDTERRLCRTGPEHKAIGLVRRPLKVKETRHVGAVKDKDVVDRVVSDNDADRKATHITGYLKRGTAAGGTANRVKGDHQEAATTIVAYSDNAERVDQRRVLRAGDNAKGLAVRHTGAVVVPVYNIVVVHRDRHDEHFADNGIDVVRGKPASTEQLATAVEAACVVAIADTAAVKNKPAGGYAIATVAAITGSAADTAHIDHGAAVTKTVAAEQRWVAAGARLITDCIEEGTKSAVINDTKRAKKKKKKKKKGNGKKGFPAH